MPVIQGVKVAWYVCTVSGPDITEQQLVVYWVGRETDIEDQAVSPASEVTERRLALIPTDI